MGKRKETPLLKLEQIQYQKSLAEGTTKREAKKLARLVSIGKKVPFSQLELQFMEQHPEYQSQVSESCYAVKCIKGFRICEDDVQVVLTKYEEVEEPLVFVTVDLNGMKARFVKKGNEHQYEEMLPYMDDNPEYKDNFFDSSLEQGAEEASKEHPKKQPKPYPRSFYNTKPADPPVPITE